MEKKNNSAYSIALIVLAFMYMGISAYLLARPKYDSSPYLFVARIAIQLIFVAEYISRLVKAGNKWQFLMHNIFDFIATVSIQPSLAFFRIALVLRESGIAGKIKATSIYKKIENLLNYPKRFISTNGLIHILYVNLFAITLGSLAVFYFEKGITFQAFGDAVWWAFVTVTTVGYGDYVPKTLMGRFVAILLMIFGIALISMLTGTIATYFNAKKDSQGSSLRLRSLIDSLDEDEIEKLLSYADEIRKAKDKTTS